MAANTPDPSGNRPQHPTPSREKGRQQQQDTGRTPQQGDAGKRGERPIADVDRKVRGGDA